MLSVKELGIPLGSFYWGDDGEASTSEEWIIPLNGDEGLTWNDFVASKYNINNIWSILDMEGIVLYNDHCISKRPYGDMILATEYIIPNQTYYITA